MADNAQPQQKPLPKTALHEFKLRLMGPVAEGGTREATLQVGVVKNNPRLDVFTNVQGDRENGKISAPMNALTFFALLDILNRAIDAEPDNYWEVPNKTGRPGQQRLLSTTRVGKDKGGRVYIAVTAEGRPMIKFVFKPGEYHEGFTRNGQPVSEAELSEIHARAWHRLFSELVPNVMNTHYIEPEPRQQGGGGGGYNNNRGGGGYNKGGYNNNRGGGGGYNKGGYNNNRGGGNGYGNRNGGGSNYGGNRGGGQQQQHGEPPAAPPSDFDDFPM